MAHALTRLVVLAVLALAGPLAQGAPALGATPAQRCEAGVASALGSCVQRVNALQRRCYAQTGAACAPGDAAVARALAGLDRTIEKRCFPDATAQAAGYGTLVTTAALRDRTREACLGEAATIAARTFGGPHAALLDGAAPADASCLDAAFAESGKLLVAAYRAQSACIRKTRGGGTCSTAVVANKVAALEGKAASKILTKCAALPALIRLTAVEYAARASAQSRCLTATGHGDAGPLDLDCGPRPGVVVPPRGTWVKVTLDEATWGTRCGNGSAYAFWLRLAPAGAPAWRVATDMQGGGVCLSESDCSGVSPGLFTAEEGQPGGGYMSSSAAVNPFHDWTRLFLPYCTQDLHIGGGTTSVFPSLTVHRYGAVNARAALRYLRDVLWAELEASDPEGWHPDRLRVLFSGESAGAFGSMYNHHYPLDELRWVNTTAAPDSGLALGPAVATLAGLTGGTASPLGWNTYQTLPPYCTANDCMSGPVIEAASVPRLEGTPWQQVLNISNQVDNVQRSTTAFPNTASWTNAVRASYCSERGQTGLHWFLPASSSSIHTMLRSDSLFATLTAQGVSPRDYLAAAMSDPESVVDRADEGTLVTAIPGVNPIPCALPPP